MSTRLAVNHSASETYWETVFRHFIQGTFLELLHRMPSSNEVGMFAYLFGQYCGSPDGDRYLNGRKWMRDQILWGPEDEATVGITELWKVHTDYLWVTVERMFNQLLTGYVGNVYAPPFTLRVRGEWASVLCNRIRQTRQRVRDHDPDEKDRALMWTKQLFGQCLRKTVKDYLGRDPFRPRLADEFLVEVALYDWWAEKTYPFRMATTDDMVTLHPVELDRKARDYVPISGNNKAYVCHQLLKMRGAGIDVATKQYQASPAALGSAIAGVRGNQDGYLRSPAHDVDHEHLQVLIGEWMKLWRRGIKAPTIAKGLDYNPCNIPYLELPNTEFALSDDPKNTAFWHDFTQSEVRYVFYAGLRGFYEQLPACMFPVLKETGQIPGMTVPPVEVEKVLIQLLEGPKGRDDPSDRAWYIPETVDLAGELDRLFAADFYGLKPWMQVGQDFVHNDERGVADRLAPIFDEDYWSWAGSASREMGEMLCRSFRLR